ncbi:MAG: 30S ribosomal protein S21 [Alphaproteobacteria bacterium RIFCSPLOWO2_01_FULL_40_26]|nr:MAG: 30S ribosomal protein S21 [Alphaproteobacteria bacterium RIFCSPHIGHO2_01_FULL_40_8]OFW93930.1 MAG: 30S ribosomal protein S21 [Alphaproteobacteria bacterium RIFCSPLOWO2_01_FULL_40_26]OFX09424.1 MAG: 30S ribosomal protein S21 [Alphaproteobacteria bacterium RIFCSPLOWO2_02_FULL_40_19]OFX11201.1 MAG: 30S ribosomal protein S21 [Alphaproteobacteria bacterium RIFCSPLOWO2_12_FULL_40_11]
MEIVVHGKANVEMAIRTFRKKTQREGLVKEARRRKAYEKPSERIKRRKDESVARRKKARRGEIVF